MIVKELSKSNFVQKIASFLIIIYIWIVKNTSKTIITGETHIINKQNPHKANYIFAFWHGREIMLPIYFTKYTKNSHNMFSVVSKHKDGNIASNILAGYGFKLIRGSSSNGGTFVLRKIIKALKQENNHICITPDGPLGPSMIFGGATIHIAKMTGAQIIPVSISVKKAKFLSSWDSFMIPLPFNKITIHIGKKIEVKKNSSTKDLEKIQRELEKNMQDKTLQLDKELSHNTEYQIGKLKKRHK